MATTVVAVAMRPSEHGTDLSFAGVGDSEAWELGPGATWRRLMPSSGGRAADDGGITTGKTKALPADNPIVVERTESITEGTVFLMTDGVGTPLAMNTEVQEQLAQWWKEPPDPFTFARQTGFARRTFVDDRTTVGIWFSPASLHKSVNHGQASEPLDESSPGAVWEAGQSSSRRAQSFDSGPSTSLRETSALSSAGLADSGESDSAESILTRSSGIVHPSWDMTADPNVGPDANFV